MPDKPLTRVGVDKGKISWESSQECLSQASCIFWIWELGWPGSNEFFQGVPELNPFFCSNDSIAFWATKQVLRVARLQNEVGTKDFFRGRNFLTKNAPKLVPEILSRYFVGPKKCRKIPTKFPAKFPSQNSKKKSPTSFCRSAWRTSANRRFEAIRANRSSIMKTGFFCESIRRNAKEGCKTYFSPRGVHIVLQRPKA